MNDQLSLDDYRLSRQVGTTERSIERNFQRFHAEHADVYAEIVRLCREWRARGRERWSIDGAFEVIRWQRHIASLPDAHEAFKLNNDFRSRYSRMVMEQEPDLAGIFTTRALHSEEAAS